MAKRYNPRAFKIHHSYTIAEVAATAGVHVQTVRGWIKQGLRCLREEKPFLILGCDVRAFMEQQNQAKTPLGKNELFCLKCRAARVPWGEMADYIPRNATSGRLTGICPTCERECQRFVSIATIGEIAPDLDVKFEGTQASLNQSDDPPSKTHIRP